MDHSSGLVFRRPQAASHRRAVVYFCSAVLTRAIIAAFIRRYNEEWIIERLDYRTPAIARQELAAVA